MPVMAAAASPPRGFCRSVHWFRRGLRLHDNPALQAALRGAASLRCIYILDPWFAASSAVGINRWRRAGRGGGLGRRGGDTEHRQCVPAPGAHLPC